MSYKSIVVYLDGHDHNVKTIRAASALAQQFDAHLAAVFGAGNQLAEVLDPFAPIVFGYRPVGTDDLLTRAKGMVATEEQQSGRPIEWRVVTERLAHHVALHARHADLLVISQPDPAESGTASKLMLESALVASGRPVLLVPSAGSHTDFGQSILIAWNDSREAARAIADALPFLKKAREVNVVSFESHGTPPRDEPTLTEIGSWLARHDVTANVIRKTSDDKDVGEQLLALAAALGSNLVVMGAYGHSRAFEIVLGGVTQTMLNSANLTVLFSH